MVSATINERVEKLIQKTMDQKDGKYEEEKEELKFEQFF